MDPQQTPQPQQPPEPSQALPEPITSVDERIAKEFAAMHPFTEPPKRGPLGNVTDYIGDGFRYHKVIAFPILIGAILIAGTVTTLALQGGSAKKDQIAVTDTSSQNVNDSTSTRDSSEDTSSDDDFTSDEEVDEESYLTDEELTDVEEDPELDFFYEEEYEDDSDFFYDPEEPMDPEGPIEDPNVPVDPPDSDPPVTPDDPPTDNPPGPNPDPNPNNPPNQPNPARLISLASFNYAWWKPATGVGQAVRALSDKADIVGFQEFGPTSHRDALSRAVRECGSCNYALYMPDIKSGGNIPIIWKKDKFQLVSKGSVKAYDPQRVEDGAGGPNVTAKHIMWVRLKHKVSGRVLFFVNLHLIPSVEKNGAPDRSVPKRLALYDKHITLLANKVNQFKQNNTPVFVSGDFNVNYNKDRQVRNAMFPYAKMDKVNTWANWRYLGAPNAGSHDKRIIDYVFASRNTKIVPKSAQILPTYGSDHHAVRMTVQIK